ncbi:hypothetical protein O0I10_008776 [Lichtheimia ornata]|uniref:DNA-directed RNA polymerase III subunit n=1 Tax=Lichtheimia ornata TaxID=688661 RepID=A0AAD7XUZ9_9FUNG|nr:uncharacterized protein O0I10_008776 [Lichtheimia ornata]KAJ8655490.1 hypothetical protein O0I10_008776 [Lichtheimia ornata]
MSRGRGGFRGGGGGAQSGAMQLVSFDMLKDLGSMFNVNTALFPEMDVPMPRKPNSTESARWELRDESISMIHDTAFYQVPPPPPPDIERYSDRYKPKPIKRTLRDLDADLDAFPEELQSIIDPRLSKRKRQARDAAADGLRDIDALLAMGEEDGKGGDEDDEEKKEGDDNAEEQFEDDYEEEEELVDDNDYAQNYFDNGEGDDIDDDDDGGDYY